MDLVLQLFSVIENLNDNYNEFMLKAPPVNNKRIH